jgi:hypothetical protein
MRKQVLIYLALAMLLPSAIAFNCNSLSGGDLTICNSIQSTNLSSYEKDLLISDIFNKNKTSPNFDFIYSWNTNLNIPNPPNGKYSSSGTIYSAWLKVITLMPSIIENNTLYASTTGKLLSAYSYQTSLPFGTESGDCKTNYYSTGSSAVLNVYLNNQFIGNNKLSAYLINQDVENLNFITRLAIKSNYNAEHYQNTKYCCKYYKNKCSKYCTKCAYSYTSYRTDTLNLEDSLTAKLYKGQLNSSFKITNEYYNITQGEINATGYTKFILSFNNSYYQISKYVYSLNYSLPYYVLTTKAGPIETETLSNIHATRENNKILFAVHDDSNCQIQLFDHFNLIIKNCDMSFNKTDFSIKTDKISYYENDTIKVYLTPSNLVFNITYANQSKSAKNYTEFKAVLFENQIRVKLNNQIKDYLINVKNKENTIIFYDLLLLAFFGYLFYKIARFYYGRTIR